MPRGTAGAQILVFLGKVARQKGAIRAPVRDARHCARLTAIALDDLGRETRTASRAEPEYAVAWWLQRPVHPLPEREVLRVAMRTDRYERNLHKPTLLTVRAPLPSPRVKRQLRQPQALAIATEVD